MAVGSVLAAGAECTDLRPSTEIFFLFLHGPCARMTRTNRKCIYFPWPREVLWRFWPPARNARTSGHRTKFGCLFLHGPCARMTRTNRKCIYFLWPREVFWCFWHSGVKEISNRYFFDGFLAFLAAGAECTDLRPSNEICFFLFLHGPCARMTRTNRISFFNGRGKFFGVFGGKCGMHGHPAIGRFFCFCFFHRPIFFLFPFIGIAHDHWPPLTLSV